MTNPWTKHNPFMSMWLSAFNVAANSARGQVTAQTQRQAAMMMTEGTRQAIRFWSAMWLAPFTTRDTTPRKDR